MLPSKQSSDIEWANLQISGSWSWSELRTKVFQHYANMRLAPDEVPASHYDGNIVFAPDEVPSTSYYPYLGIEVLGRTLQAQDRITIAEQQSIVWSMQCTQHISTIMIDRSVWCMDVVLHTKLYCEVVTLTRHLFNGGNEEFTDHSFVIKPTLT